MGILQSVSRTKVFGPRKIVVYGGNGVGKSSLLAGVAGTLYIRPEDNLAHLDVDALPKPATWGELMEQLRGVHEEPHSYINLVIDTLDDVQRLMELDIEATTKKAFKESNFGNYNAAAKARWEDFMAWIDAIVHDRGVTVIMLAHCDTLRFNNPEGEDFHKYNMRLHKWATNEIRKWANDVLFATMPISVKGVGDEPPAGSQIKQKKIGQLRGTRILRTVETAACFAKNQCGLPAEIPLSWAEYAKYAFPGGQANVVTGEVVGEPAPEPEWGEVGGDDGAYSSDTVEAVEGDGQ